VGAPLLRTPWADGEWDSAGGWLRVEFKRRAEGDAALAGPWRTHSLASKTPPSPEAGKADAVGAAGAFITLAETSAPVSVRAGWRTAVVAHVAGAGAAGVPSPATRASTCASELSRQSSMGGETSPSPSPAAEAWPLLSP
jgi:hypothetical protein